MQLFKALLLVSTLAGLTMASYSKEENYHRKGGIIKRTILIDGCTGQPIDKHPYPHHDEIDPGFAGPHGDAVPIDSRHEEIHDASHHEKDEPYYEDRHYSDDDFDNVTNLFDDYENGSFGDEGSNWLYRDESEYSPI